MKIPIYQVSAFARDPFSGNPAAVCPLEQWLRDEVMQGIAAENNLSETAFFVRRPDGAFDLRWFTPTVEVDLCGHATLASGYVVLEQLGGADQDTVTFHTRSGELNVRRKGGFFALDLPANPPSDDVAPEMKERVSHLLGVDPVDLLDAGLPVAVLESEAQVSSLAPDFRQMLDVGIPWLSVTAEADDDETDFVSRYFAPGSGIDEDPVTGSAHGWLVPYWSQRFDKKRMKARQVSKRGGWLDCEDLGETVSVAGRVNMFLKGEITLSDK